MNFIIQMVLRRLKEPSSFAGLGGVLVACGISLPGGDAALQHIILSSVALRHFCRCSWLSAARRNKISGWLVGALLAGVAAVAAVAYFVARKITQAEQLKEIARAKARMDSVRASTLRGTTERMRDNSF